MNERNSRLQVKNEKGEWVQVVVPKSVKAIVLLNLQSYAGGRDLWGLKDVSKDQAKGFYHVHAGKPFFDGLCAFMSSGPLFLMVLEKDNAIADLRKLMGATNPAQAEEGTIRKKFAASIGENAIHGSDAEDTAAFEIGYFFGGMELK